MSVYAYVPGEGVELFIQYADLIYISTVCARLSLRI